MTIFFFPHFDLIQFNLIVLFYFVLFCCWHAGVTPLVEQPLTISNSQFVNNLAASDGAGVAVMLASNYSVTNCLFRGNIARLSGAGFFDGNGYATCRANISLMIDSVFVNNSAQQVQICVCVCVFSRKGGGLFIRGCNTTVTNTTFRDNSAIGLGGSLMIDAASGRTMLSQLVVTNSQSGRHGGGIAITGGNVFLTNVTLMNNTASQNGGGLYVRGTQGWVLNVDLQNAVIDWNTASQGGGASIESNVDFYNWTSKPEVKFTYVSIAHNKGITNGGGISIQNGALATSQCYFDSNQAKNGSGISYQSGWYQDYQVPYFIFFLFCFCLIFFFLCFFQSRNKLTTYVYIVCSEKNAASEMGGGIYAAETSVGLNETKFARNSAKYGGAIYAAKCFIKESKNVNFSQNVAKFSGGAIQVPFNCSTWCVDCHYQVNEAPSGQDQSTGPAQMR
ncbi:Polymorphic membrane protein, partial [Reticulomyxa filosa]